VDRLKKEAFIEEFTERSRGAELVVLAGFSGLSVEKMNQLRRKMEADTNAYIRVVKNRLFRRVIEGTPMEGLSEQLKGPTAVILGFDDPVGPARVLRDFAKENSALEIKSGFFDNKVVSTEELNVLASLPSKEELHATLVGTLSAPLSQFVGVLAAAPQQFVGVLSAYKSKLEGE